MSERQLYRLWDGKDTEPPFGGRGAVPITRDEAPRLNALGFGIFWTVNDFRNAERTKENLLHIRSWAIDLDGGDKDQQFNLICRGPKPSMVVETKSGFHVYWDAEDGTAETWEPIVWDRLCPFYGGDKRAKDYCRILRVPGFYHMKNPQEPFLIEVVFQNPVTYSAATMLAAFPTQAKIAHRYEVEREIKTHGSQISDRIYNLNCLDALKRLSGSAAVGGEQYEFRSNGNGNHNIFVNGKSTSCFIDRNMRIGATPGGPTIWTWLQYFNHSDKEIVNILRQYFPEIWSGI